MGKKHSELLITSIRKEGGNREILEPINPDFITKNKPKLVPSLWN